MAVISKGITLSYLDKADNGSFAFLTNLQEIPELGGDFEAIEITTLADGAHRYTNGIMNYGDSLAFKFLYESQQFAKLTQMASDVYGFDWEVTFPDGATCTFSGTCGVKLDGVGVNAALTYTLSIKPDSAMIWANSSLD